MDLWLPTVLASLDRLKEQEKADGIKVIGRKGWVKKLSEYGYQEFATVVIKE